MLKWIKLRCSGQLSCSLSWSKRRMAVSATGRPALRVCACGSQCRLFQTLTGPGYDTHAPVQTSREDAAAAAQAELQAQWAPTAQQQGGDAGGLGLDTFFVYHSRSGNMLTPANLGGMRAARPSEAFWTMTVALPLV